MSTEPHTLKLIERLVKPGDHCMDAGAHTGEMSDALLKAAGPAGRLYLFEILEQNLKALRERFGRSSNVAVIPKALCEAPGTRTMYLARSGSTFESNILGLDMNDAAMRASGQVPCTSVDAVMRDLVPRLDFLKVDVEGAEHLVLAGAAKTLKELRPLVFVEFHNDTGWDGRRHLKDAGYAIMAVYHMNQVLNKWLDYDSPRHYHCLCVPEEKRAAVEASYLAG